MNLESENIPPGKVSVNKPNVQGEAAICFVSPLMVGNQHCNGC